VDNRGRIERAVERAAEDARVPYVGGARAAAEGARFLAVGDPQAPLASFLGILADHALLGDDGRLAADVHLVSMGDHFDWGSREEREPVARSGLETLAWLAAHPPRQVTLVLGNHDLGRVGELARYDDEGFRAAQAEADAVVDGAAAAERFAARHPDVPTFEVLSRDLSSFRVAQQQLVAALLRARRVCLAQQVASPVVLSHAGVTLDELASLGLDGQPPDAAGVAAALNAALDAAVASWPEGTRLAIPNLHEPGSAASGEGRGMLYHRPAQPTGPRLDDSGRDLFAGPPRRRFDPRRLPRGLVQAIGHIGDRKCRWLLESWAPSPATATFGRVRHLRTDGRDGRYALGVPDAWPANEAVMLFLDGTMAAPRARPYELLDLAALAPAARE
jgi:hypothetical protein